VRITIPSISENEPITSRLSAAARLIALLASLIPATHVRGQETNSLAISLIPGIWSPVPWCALYRVEYAIALTPPSPVWSFLTNIILAESRRSLPITPGISKSHDGSTVPSAAAPFAADSFFQFSGQQGQ